MSLVSIEQLIPYALQFKPNSPSSASLTLFKTHWQNFLNLFLKRKTGLKLLMNFTCILYFSSEKSKIFAGLPWTPRWRKFFSDPVPISSPPADTTNITLYVHIFLQWRLWIYCGFNPRRYTRRWLRDCVHVLQGPSFNTLMLTVPFTKRRSET